MKTLNKITGFLDYLFPIIRLITMIGVLFYVIVGMTHFKETKVTDMTMDDVFILMLICGMLFSSFNSDSTEDEVEEKEAKVEIGK